MNQVSLIGLLTRNPERRLGTRTTVCRLRLAVDRGSRDGTGFFDITAFGRTGEVCAEFLTRGRQVGVSGRLRHSEWTADDGSKRSRVEVIADRVQFLGGRRDAGPPMSQNDPEPVSQWAPDHDIEF